MFEGFKAIIIIIVISIGLFILLREFFCWYWKINERRDLLIEILNQIKNQKGNSDLNYGQKPGVESSSDEPDLRGQCKSKGTYKWW